MAVRGFGLAACIGVGIGLGSVTADAVPLFALDNGALDPQPCGGTGCWTNYVRLADLDGDGDLDLVIPNYEGFVSMGSPQELVVYTGDGAGGWTNNSAAAVGGYSGRLRQVAIGDVDGDGDPDMVAPDGAGGPNALFINDGAAVFTDEGAARLPAASVNAGGVRLGDVDADGDLDIVIADGYAQGQGAASFGALWINDGAGMFTDQSAGLPPPAGGGEDPEDIDLADVDRDFDLDILINAHQGPSVLWLNDGGGTFTDGTAQMAPPGGNNFHYGPTFCDVDGDGDLDLWVDNIGGGFTEQLLINDGSGTFTDQTSARVMGNPAADDNGVSCVDVDDDGDFDAVVVSLGDEERVLENDGAGNFVAVGDAFPAVGDSSLWIDFGDVDGDGRLDAVTGQGESPARTNRVYLGIQNQPVDGSAPRIIATEQIEGPLGPTDAPAVRFAVSDRAVTDGGPRLNRAFVRVEAGSMVEIDALFMGGDLFRAALPAAAEGTVTYTACAVDRAGNEGCGMPLTYEVGGMGAETGMGDASGTASDSGPTTTASGTNSGSAGTGGSGDGTAGQDGGGDGCGCRSPAGPTHGRNGWIGMLLAIAVARRRRRR